jgi:circadian clock protein KaiC
VKVWVPQIREQVFLAIKDEALDSIKKVPTGIAGVDQITNGGFPFGRSTLVFGGPGCGKSLLAAEFVVRGAEKFGEPGVIVSFEESPEEIVLNLASLGLDVRTLQEKKLLAIEYFKVEPIEQIELGEYDLRGLFVRLDAAINSVGAKRVALDSIGILSKAFLNKDLVRATLHRLCHWLKERQVTTVFTSEVTGDRQSTNITMEEYLVDCCISLDHRVDRQLSTRRIRVIKYRGSQHGLDEYPFLITSRGIVVNAIAVLDMQYSASNERISSGILRLDTMLGGGLYRGSSIMVSGPAGIGKTSIGGCFVESACSAGERAIYLSFEESPSHIMRNLSSIGLRLGSWVEEGRLRIISTRPDSCGLEQHLRDIETAVEEFQPQAIVLDPVSSLSRMASDSSLQAMLGRLVDFLKRRCITSIFNDLEGFDFEDRVDSPCVSSVMDVWMRLNYIDTGSERNRTLSILKARGIAHSNQKREFKLTNTGVVLEDVFAGDDGVVLTGSALLAQKRREEQNELDRLQRLQTKRREITGKQELLAAQIKGMQLEMERQEMELKFLEDSEIRRSKKEEDFKEGISRARFADR